MRIKFSIKGNMRYLSHAETMSMFKRAFVRSGVSLAYSGGFNPRPKVSVAVARSVGLAGDNEILDVRLSGEDTDADKDKMKQMLSEQLPADVIIGEVFLSDERPSSQATGADYEVPLGMSMEKQEIERTIEEVIGSEELLVERTINAKGEKRRIDVRDFIISMEGKGDSVMVKTKMTPTGTIRVDEICSVLGLEMLEGGGSVTRSEIYWEQ